jgi:DNA ligase-1
MKQFAALYAELDATTSTAAKLAALQRHLAQADPADAAWAVYMLAGGRPKRVVRLGLLRALACEMAGVADWLFEACYQAVGDLAETIAHVLPAVGSQDDEAGLSVWLHDRILPLRALDEAQARARVQAQWLQLDALGRMLWVKLATGGFRVGVSRQLEQRALSAHAGLPLACVAERMMGYTDSSRWPTAQAYAELITPLADGVPAQRGGQPYPFFLAHALTPQERLEDLGATQDWQIEWKYDGIRAQLVKRAGQVWLWSRGEELITPSFPEVPPLAARLPEGTVLDGELLAWGDGVPAPFAQLQQRLGRKRLPAALLARVPVAFVAYDLLEQDGQDIRALTQAQRRERLERLLADQPIALAPCLGPASWAEVERLRQSAEHAEGLMLKRLGSPYGSGRTRGAGLWLKYKREPWVIDGVLLYAQAGHGRRASLYSDYTFAVWNRPPLDAAQAQAVIEAIARREPLVRQADVPLAAQALQLVPFTKAYSGLSEQELGQVDAHIKRTLIDKFGPVRSVRPSLVFEIAFEGIGASSRHKSGVALRFPRINRLRPDKPLHEVSSLADLLALLPGSKSG